LACVFSRPGQRIVTPERYANHLMKRTWQPKRIPRKRTHGFLKRMASPGGRNVIKARRLKGRHRLTV